MTMNAAFYTGDKTFRIEQVEPKAPAANEVQIKVAFCGICGTDLHVYLGHMDKRVGLHRIVGHEMSGTVSAIGADVQDVAVGDHVVVRPLDHCGDCPACLAGFEHICHKLKFLGLDTDGAMQQRWNVPAHTTHKLPDGVSLKLAALIEPLAVACHDVRRAQVSSGDDVLVIGGGPIGMLVAMVARNVGGKVTLSEINEHRIAFAAKLGFRSLNPKSCDVAAEVMAQTDGKGADVVFEVSGVQAAVDLMTAAAATRARLVMVAIHASKPQIDMFQFFWRELELLGARVYEREDYDRAIAMIASGEIDTASLITDVKPLTEVGAAFAELAGNPQAMKTLLQINDEVSV